MTTLFFMDSSLTIRIPLSQRLALKQRAQSTGKSESALVRELLEREIPDPGFQFERVRHLAGSSDGARASRDSQSWREHLRKSNWRK